MYLKIDGNFFDDIQTLINDWNLQILYSCNCNLTTISIQSTRWKIFLTKYILHTDVSSFQRSFTHIAKTGSMTFSRARTAFVQPKVIANIYVSTVWMLKFSGQKQTALLFVASWLRQYIPRLPT